MSARNARSSSTRARINDESTRSRRLAKRTSTFELRACWMSARSSPKQQCTRAHTRQNSSITLFRRAHLDAQAAGVLDVRAKRFDAGGHASAYATKPRRAHLDVRTAGMLDVRAKCPTAAACAHTRLSSWISLKSFSPALSPPLCPQNP